jgi:molybdopterin synthase sulfur carrier subunit
MTQPLLERTVPGTAMIHVTVRLFAQLRERAGASRLERHVPAATSAGGLTLELLRELDLSRLADTLVVALDGDYVDPGTLLHEGAELVLVPPVSGGAELRCPDGYARKRSAPVDL